MEKDRVGNAATPKNHATTEYKRDPRRDIKPNKFNGRGCIETFLTQFQICADHNGWTEEDKASHLKCCLVDEAGQLIWDSGRPGDISYADLKEKLRRRYGSVDQQEKYWQLRTRRRTGNESLAQVYQDIRGLMTRAYPGQAASDMGEQMARDHFLSVLNDRELELKIRERFPNTLDEAFKHAVQSRHSRILLTQELLVIKHETKTADQGMRVWLGVSRNWSGRRLSMERSGMITGMMVMTWSFDGRWTR